MVDFMTSSSDEDVAEIDYRNSLVNFALQKIDEVDRGLISLYYYNELNIEEISGITGISKSNIKVRLFRARQKMAEIIYKAEKQNVIYHD